MIQTVSSLKTYNRSLEPHTGIPIYRNSEYPSRPATLQNGRIRFATGFVERVKSYSKYYHE